MRDEVLKAINAELLEVGSGQFLYVCDTGARCTTQPLAIQRAVTVWTSLPWQHHYSQFAKDAASVYFWPIWTIEELMACRTDLFLPDVTESMVAERFEEVGGVVRHIAREPEAYRATVVRM